MTPPQGVPSDGATCASCGRRMEPRRSDSGQPNARKYCSKACRSRKVQPVDSRLEDRILSLLAARPGGGSICPSEAARAEDPTDWRELMEPARRAARRLVAHGSVEITQGGRPVDPSTAKGPIRIRASRTR